MLEKCSQVLSDLDEERLLTPGETAQCLAVSVDLLKVWRRHGRGPAFVKAGGRIRYSFRALRNYLAERTTRPMSAPFYRRTKVEELDGKHPGLRRFVEKRQQRRVSYQIIAAEILQKWGERISAQALSNFFIRRVWPKESSQRRG
jgi:hypothetical protein